MAKSAPAQTPSPKPIRSVAFVSLGCPKNLVDSERMLGLLAQDGLAITNDPAVADAIVVNDVSRQGIGFDSERNAVTIITHDEVIEVPETTKLEVAQRVLDVVARLKNRNHIVSAQHT